MKVSLILPSYKRPELLNLGLWSISQQKSKYELEVIVVNDGVMDSTFYNTIKYSKQFHIVYVFSGYRNLKNTPKFRSPSVAINIGIKKAVGDIIILSNPECFHLNNTIDIIVGPLMNNKEIISTPKHIYFDNTSMAKNYIASSPTLNLPEDIMDDLESGTKRCQYASRLPFCMGMYKNRIVDIGAYDEEFSGWACDDDDIVERLLLSGLSLHYCGAKVVHLYHDKQYDRTNRLTDPDYLHNLKLFKEKKGTIIRNQSKEWGVNNEG